MSYCNTTGRQLHPRDLQAARCLAGGRARVITLTTCMRLTLDQAEALRLVGVVVGALEEAA